MRVCPVKCYQVREIGRTTLHMTKYASHTRTVVRECYKGDEASQWKRPKFDEYRPISSVVQDTTLKIVSVSLR